jgi:hypothetical protein
MREHPSISELEQLLAGDLDPTRAAEIEHAAEADPALKSWLAERRAEIASFRADPRRKSFSELRSEAEAEPRSLFDRIFSPPLRPIWATAGVGLVAASIAFALFAPKPEDDGIHVRGGVAVRAAVLHEGQTSRLYEGGEALHPGDRVRLTVDDPHGGWVTVMLEEEASGKVSVIYAPKELGRLDPGTHILPESLELDRALGRERLYVVVSDDEPAVESWVKELRTAREKRSFRHGWLPPGTTRIATIEWEKVEAP